MNDYRDSKNVTYIKFRRPPRESPLRIVTQLACATVLAGSVLYLIVHLAYSWAGR